MLQLVDGGGGACWWCWCCSGRDGSAGRLSDRLSVRFVGAAAVSGTELATGRELAACHYAWRGGARVPDFSLARSPSHCSPVPQRVAQAGRRRGRTGVAGGGVVFNFFLPRVWCQRICPLVPCRNCSPCSAHAATRNGSYRSGPDSCAARLSLCGCRWVRHRSRDRATASAAAVAATGRAITTGTGQLSTTMLEGVYAACEVCFDYVCASSAPIRAA